MRYGIFGDVHSNLEALEAMIHAFKDESIEQYLCVGDIVGYAANPIECIERIRSLPAVIVAGNHDWAAVNLFSLDYFNPIACEAIIWTKARIDEERKSFLEGLKLTFMNKDLTLVHGTLNNPNEFNYMTDGFIAEETFRLFDTPVCFVGHTHVPGIFSKDASEHILYREDDSCNIEQGSKYIINVGSVGQPRDGNPKASYCIYDTGIKEIQIKRVDYDIEATRTKINNFGLPEYLGHRLFLGR